MAHGRKTGGRPNGALNKATIARQTAVAEAVAELTPTQIEGMSPKDAILWAMRTALRHGDLRMALLAAEKAAPYMHVKLASVEMRTEIKDTRYLTDEELMIIAARGLPGGQAEADAADSEDEAHRHRVGNGH